jgi:hypothetical protein
MVAAVRRPLYLALLLPLLGCDNLSEFRGSFEGTVVSGSFVRSCFADRIVAHLDFDPAQAVLSAGEVPDGGNRLTIESDAQVVFKETPLEPFSLLSNDTLADFDFPGPKRLRNFMLVARPETGPLAGRDALVVVSLLANKSVELRVIARGDETDEPCPDELVEDGGVAPTKAREYYGLFRLNPP